MKNLIKLRHFLFLALLLITVAALGVYMGQLSRPSELKDLSTAFSSGTGKNSSLEKIARLKKSMSPGAKSVHVKAHSDFLVETSPPEISEGLVFLKGTITPRSDFLNASVIWHLPGSLEVEAGVLRTDGVSLVANQPLSFEITLKKKVDKTSLVHLEVVTDSGGVRVGGSGQFQIPSTADRKAASVNGPSDSATQLEMNKLEKDFLKQQGFEGKRFE